jgi:hypothetical protein
VTACVAPPPSVAARARTFAVLCTLGLLAGCVSAPSEGQRKQAIADHVLRAEAYPREFVHTENFAYRNLLRVPDAEPVQFGVDADFEVVYDADGKAIVEALRAQARAEREKQQRRTDTVVEKVTAVLGDALASVEFEQRFEDVRIGDRDQYTGHFVLARNEDGSWRVVSADYR